MKNAYNDYRAISISGLRPDDYSEESQISLEQAYSDFVQSERCNKNLKTVGETRICNLLSKNARDAQNSIIKCWDDHLAKMGNTNTNTIPNNTNTMNDVPTPLEPLPQEEMANQGPLGNEALNDEPTCYQTAMGWCSNLVGKCFNSLMTCRSAEAKEKTH